MRGRERALPAVRRTVDGVVRVSAAIALRDSCAGTRTAVINAPAALILVFIQPRSACTSALPHLDMCVLLFASLYHPTTTGAMYLTDSLTHRRRSMLLPPLKSQANNRLLTLPVGIFTGLNALTTLQFVGIHALQGRAVVRRARYVTRRLFLCTIIFVPHLRRASPPSP